MRRLAPFPPPQCPQCPQCPPSSPRDRADGRADVADDARSRERDMSSPAKIGARRRERRSRPVLRNDTGGGMEVDVQGHLYKGPARRTPILRLATFVLSRPCLNCQRARQARQSQGHLDRRLCTASRPPLAGTRYVVSAQNRRPTSANDGAAPSCSTTRAGNSERRTVVPAHGTHPPSRAHTCRHARARTAN